MNDCERRRGGIRGDVEAEEEEEGEEGVRTSCP